MAPGGGAKGQTCPGGCGWELPAEADVDFTAAHVHVHDPDEVKKIKLVVVCPRCGRKIASAKLETELEAEPVAGRGVN